MVSTHLKNISQIESLPHVGVKIKNVWNHHLDNGGYLPGKMVISQEPVDKLGSTNGRSAGTGGSSRKHQYPVVWACVWWIFMAVWGETTHDVNGIYIYIVYIYIWYIYIWYIYLNEFGEFLFFLVVNEWVNIYQTSHWVFGIGRCVKSVSQKMDKKIQGPSGENSRPAETAWQKCGFRMVLFRDNGGWGTMARWWLNHPF